MRHQLRIPPTFDRYRDETGAIGYIFLWLLGVPLPVIILLALFWHN